MPSRCRPRSRMSAPPTRAALRSWSTTCRVGITSQLKDGDAIIAKVKQVLTAARSAGVRTLLHPAHVIAQGTDGRIHNICMAMAWQRIEDPAAVKPWFLRDSPGFAIPFRSPPPLASEAIFDKLAMSAFEGTPLEFAARATAGFPRLRHRGDRHGNRHRADRTSRRRPRPDPGLVIADACGAGHADAAKRSLESLAFAGDAMITDVARFGELMARSQAR